MSSLERSITPEEFTETLKSQCVRLLLEQTGSPWKIADVTADREEDSEFDFHVDTTFSGALSGVSQIRVAAPYVLVMASALLSRACDDMGEAEGEVLKGFAQEVATTFCKTQAAAPVEITAVSQIASGLREASTVSSFTLVDEEGREATIEIRLTEELELSLSGRRLDPPIEESPEPGSLQSEAPSAASTQSEGMRNETGRALGDPVEPVNLDLVLEVELSVTLRFGQRQLSLREVLELTSGSVVELDRQVEEPVELLLDGKVIARGEAVVIDGNYGMRITEVPQQFLPSMLR